MQPLLTEELSLNQTHAAQLSRFSQYPASSFILEELGRQMPFLLKATLDASCSPIEERLPALELIGQRLSRLHGNLEKWVSNVVRSYVVLSLEFLKLQRQLEETGRYLLSTEREAKERVYHNEDVFGSYYLSGLLLSEALWPNHYRLGTNFTESFVPLLPPSARLLEGGVGTGYYLSLLFTHCPGVNYEGFDLSDYAIEFAQQFAFGRGGTHPNAKFFNCDITKQLERPQASYDAIILGEVLEHVEKPDQLLRELARVARPEAPMFMTTVIFAANIDHIYLFEKADDIRNLISKTEWRIDREWILPIYPDDEPEMEKRPMNYGALLRNG